MTKALSQVSDTEGAEESRCPAVSLNSALSFGRNAVYPPRAFTAHEEVFLEGLPEM